MKAAQPFNLAGGLPRRGDEPRPRPAFAAFTLIELLVVISIMALIASLAVPALKNLGKSNSQAAAARQMLDDVARARQMAIGQHTTVYMVFVPTNFWLGLTTLTPAQATVASNLCDKQLTGYTFITLRSVGDQPGQHTSHYLGAWQSLPDGTFVAQQKFQQSPSVPYYIYGNNATYAIYGFHTTNSLPFPTPDSPILAANYWPYIAFNYLGQLTVDGLNPYPNDEFIPLAQGTITPARDPVTKAPTLLTGTAPMITETPPGNSSSSMYNIIHIDHLTGRATLEYQHLQ